MSAGGWSDLAPTLVLKNMGCERVVYVTREGDESGFATKIAKNLGMDEAAWKALYESGWRSLSLDEKFDVSIAIGVFDYQNKPAEFMRRMVARTNGKVIGSFPGRSLIRMPLRKFRYWWGDCPVYFYREAEVRDIAEKAGFTSFEIVPIHTSGTGFMLIGTI